MPSGTLTFLPREFKGSRLRCLLLTHRRPADIADFFTRLAAPQATVTEHDRWAPRGFPAPDEAKLGETPGFLTDDHRRTLTAWWLAHPGRANTPNWDLACRATIGGRDGLILVEAKAHEGEMADDRCGATNRANHQRIVAAMRQATDGLNGVLPGFALSADSHYQLGNRFAFAWKLATLGVPVVLVYLGFLNAHEMAGPGRTLLATHEQWRQCVMSRAHGTIPNTAWGTTLLIDGVPLTVLIRSAEVRIDAAVL